jgi:hypothetical protein
MSFGGLSHHTQATALRAESAKRFFNSRASRAMSNGVYRRSR